MSHDPKQSAQLATRLLALNQLVLKAINSESLKALRFVILNDTISIIRYDRCVLWSYSGSTPKLEGISGQSKPNTSSALAQKWNHLLRCIKDPTNPQFLTEASFHGCEDLWNEVHEHSKVGVLWIPIEHQGEMILGMWVERWHKDSPGVPPTDTIKMLTQILVPAFGASWHHLSSNKGWLRRFREKRALILGVPLLTLALLFGVRVPLRVVAPCEIVASSPYVITAPMEGVIEELAVAPGVNVKAGDTLYTYNSEELDQNRQVAEKQVQIMEGAINRASTMGHDDAESLSELALFKLRLEQEQLRLELAEFYESQAKGKAPVDGLTVIDDPERWRGRPVQIGEQIMTLSDPEQSKVRLWLPESDNIALKTDEPIKLYLNVDPSTSYSAKLSFIANRSSLNEQQLPSFVAEAEWESDETPKKLGLKGSAVAYGDRVSLFYFLFRRPWTTLRNFLGV